MNNEEIEYWNSFLKTINFLPIRGENDYNFMDRLRRVVSLHINRLERVILVDEKEYMIFNKDTDTELLRNYFGSKYEDVLDNPCSFCHLREKCQSGQEFCSGKGFIYLEYMIVLGLIRDTNRPIKI